MRQDVCNHSPTVVLALAAMALSVVASGCQLTKPPKLPDTPQFNSAYKPPTAASSSSPVTKDSNEDIPALSASAQIRGQTGNSWNSGTAGDGDNYRTPMVATEPNPNRYAAPATGYQTGTPQFNPSSTTVYQPPTYSPSTPNSYAPNFGTSPSAITGTPPAYGAPSATFGGEAYGAPGSYAAPQGYAAPGSYDATVAPGVTQSFSTPEAVLAPGIYVDPMAGINAPEYMIPGQYQPRQRITPLDVYAQEARTGRIVLGGSVNSDLGVAGQVIIEERNFDFRRVPSSWSELWSGNAFRGDGQNFRAELMPGNRVERYTVNWSTPRVLDYLPYSLSVGGFYYTRQFRDWTEQRIGGRAALGYEVTKDLSISSELRLEDVKLFDARLNGVQELDEALGSSDLYTARFRIAHDTRDSPFMSTEGALLELVYDQVFGEYDYPRGQVNYSRYFLVDQRPDGSGRKTIASTWRLGVTGAQTPIFENYYAGGYSTLRGFSFRGASPTVGDVQVGGEMMFLGSLEYIFPLTADEMLRGVAFVDYGTVERDIEFNSENFRVAPGLGLRVAVPALGPAPLAFDFAYPINHSDTDDRQIFSFFMGFTR